MTKHHVVCRFRVYGDTFIENELVGPSRRHPARRLEIFESTGSPHYEDDGGDYIQGTCAGELTMLSTKA